MIAVISPHLDDGVFGCGALLAAHPGSVVITAFAAGPPPSATLTRWDAECGFAPGDDVLAARRAEDREALALLDATPVWLDFADAQYAEPPRPATLGAALDRAVVAVRAHTVLVPLGLFHSDHRLTCEAVLPLVRARPGRRWFVYEDAIYRRVPGLASGALVRLVARGHSVTPAALALPAAPPALLERKRRAVACYRSQLRGLAASGRPGIDDVFAPERFWRLLA